MTKSKFGLQVFLIAILAIFFAACRTQLSGNEEITNGQNKTLNESSIVQDSSINTNGNDAPDEAYGEIKECSPQKLSIGDVLKIKLAVPNGGNLAIVRDKSKDGFFLLSDEQKSSQSAEGNLFWTIDELKKIPQIEIDTANATAVDITRLNSQGIGKPELIFSRAGWYIIEIADENFEQDDPPITGRCRVFFSGNAAQQSKPANSEVLFDFRKEPLLAEPKINQVERQRVMRAVLTNDEDTAAFEIGGKETGAFTASGNQNQTAYLLRPDVTSITQDPTNPAKSILAIFEGEKLIAKFDVGSYFFIAAKADTNRDGVDELLLVGNNLQMGIETKWAELISVNQNKMQVVKDFKTVYENTCEGVAVKKKNIRAAVVKYEFTQNQNSPVFSSQNLIQSCK